MSSDEFTRWIAWYRIWDGVAPARGPAPEERWDRLMAFAAVHNAKLAAKESR